MREIKFRQAIFLKGKFHHWHYWGYVGYRGEFIGPLTISGIRNEYEVKDSQQYIGRKDKSGKGIYEGDLFRDATGVILQVAWANQYSRYMASPDGNWCIFYLNEPMRPEQDTEAIEIIGHTHKNPE